jgi:hypothetical protein
MGAQSQHPVAAASKSSDCRLTLRMGRGGGVRESELGGRCARGQCGDWSCGMRVCVLEEERDREEVERTKLYLCDRFLI